MRRPRSPRPAPGLPRRARGAERARAAPATPPAPPHAQGDIILVGLRDYQDEKADVILKYMADEARSLKSYGELPDNIRVNEGDTFNDEENNDEYFDFDDTDDRQEAEDIDGDLGLGDLDVDDI